jgi:hypothetical protein
MHEATTRRHSIVKFALSNLKERREGDSAGKPLVEDFYLCGLHVFDSFPRIGFVFSSRDHCINQNRSRQFAPKLPVFGQETLSVVSHIYERAPKGLNGGV